ncbi:MAG: molybdopterin converting factor subunit 1 [Acetobacteraceae bacterium]|nr:molybdopterin converting factor subunit 1 [Acetobacteraceae bacterium]
MLKILYFAALRERMGRNEEDVDAPANVATVADLIVHLRDRDPAGAAAFAQPSLVRAAVNQEFSNLHSAIRDGDEIAFFPPVTGG